MIFFRDVKTNVHRNLSEGFTLVEMLLSVGILVVIVTISSVWLGGVKTRTEFSLTAQNALELLRNAQSKSVSQDNNQSWGMHTAQDTPQDGMYALFSGDSYATSSVSDLERLGSSARFTNPWTGFVKDVLFSTSSSGAPSLPQTFSLKSTVGSSVAITTVSRIGFISQTLEESLGAYWPFDEGNGAVAHNVCETTGGATSTISGMWKNSGCIFGSCADMSSYAGYFNAGTLSGSLLNSSSSPFSVSLWFNVSSPYSRNFLRCSSGFSLQTTGGGLAQAVVGVNTLTQSVGSVSSLRWHHLALVAPLAGTSSLYLDGIAVATSTSVHAPASCAGDLIIGSSDLLGYLDEVRLYTRALSSSDVQSIYASY